MITVLSILERRKKVVKTISNFFTCKNQTMILIITLFQIFLYETIMNSVRSKAQTWKKEDTITKPKLIYLNLFYTIVI